LSSVWRVRVGVRVRVSVRVRIRVRVRVRVRVRDLLEQRVDAADDDEQHEAEA